MEIDVWPSSSPEGLVVTHGYTFTKGVSFREVCEAIGVGVDNLGPDAWPVLVSLECHVGPKGQQIMVDILKNAWGEKLVEGKLTDGSEEEVTVSPRELKGRIILMVRSFRSNLLYLILPQVEYYAPSNFAEVEAEEELEELDPDQEEESTSSDSIVEGEDLPQVLVGEIERGKISDELAALGYYARSWKPTKGWLQQGNFL